MPLWWWPIGFGVSALLAAEVHMGYPGIRSWLPYLLTVPLTAAILIRMGRHRIRLDHGELYVGPAHIPLRHLGRVELVTPEDKRRAMGPELDPAAFVLHAGWVRPLVRVELTDPHDTTPYWIFSVKGATELAELLRVGAVDARRPGSDGHPSATATDI